MNRFFSEAMNHHPEFLRLNQRIRELEKENEQLREQASAKVEIDLEESVKYIEELEGENLKLSEAIEYFNTLSPIRKMCYHFNLD